MKHTTNIKLIFLLKKKRHKTYNNPKKQVKRHKNIKKYNLN